MFGQSVSAQSWETHIVNCAPNLIVASYQHGYNSHVETFDSSRSTLMRTVNIADLKNNLSAYLERVRKGEELLVKDRNRPIAKLVPLAVGEDLDSEELELAADLVRLPAKS